MDERRKHIRFSKSFAVTYKPLGQIIRPSCTSKDISLTGISLAVYHRLSCDTLIKMWIELKDFKKPIVATGQVVWLKDTHEPSFPYQVGIKFVEIHPSDKQVLLNQIRSICEEEKIPFVGLLE